MVAPTYAYTTASDTFTYNLGTAVVNVYNPAVTAIGGTQTLQRRPNLSAFGYGAQGGSADCQWLWNDVLAVQSKWFDPTENYTCAGGIIPLDGTITDGTPYEPVNAVDSSSPWDRVFVPNPDYACDTCYCAGCGGTSTTNPRQHYRCGNFIYFSSGVLYIAEGGAPAGSPPIFGGAVMGGGYWYWVFDFKAFSAISWSFNRSATSGLSEAHNAMSSAGIPPYDIINNQPNFGGHVVGGRALDANQELQIVIRYVKQIDCATDFEGSPITLTFDRIVPIGNPGETFVMSTYPSSVTITLS